MREKRVRSGSARKARRGGWPLVVLVLSAMVLASPLLVDLFSRVVAMATITSMSASSVEQDDPGLAACREQAEAYNALLGGYDGPGVADVLPYDQQLSYQGDEAMAWVEVPKADIRLPVYHGTSDAVLAAGVGHLEGSSLPVGGASSHCILTAHSGMPGSSAFDEIRRLETGDVFYVHTLGVTYAYRVYDIGVVLPEEVSSLAIERGRDLCTLVTCTPYGVNDHRLLVHGERTEMPEEGADTERPAPVLSVRSVLGMVAAALVLGVLVWCRVRRRKARPRHMGGHKRS